MEIWVSLLAIMAVYRASHLIALDDFPASMAIRGRVIDHFGEKSWQADLIGCMWCISVWLGAAIVIVTDMVVGVPVPVLLWGAASAITGLIATVEPD